MNRDKVVITGAAGFIGSNLARRFYNEGIAPLVLVDDFNRPEKEINLNGIGDCIRIDRRDFPQWLSEHHAEVDMVYHLGARTDTTEFDEAIFEELNLNYSKSIWQICTDKQLPLVYASSAATYGSGKQGFSDEHNAVKRMRPLNPYGWSKQYFDLFVLAQQQTPPFWAGLKFFNVYGPYESHKGRMASVAFHAYHQIKDTGWMTLFRSHRPEYANGEQLRDFIYVDDIVNICLFFWEKRELSGIYNCGTGNPRSFNDLARALFAELKKPKQIEYIPIPLYIRDRYQYFTRARTNKLLAAGYDKPFTTLEEAVHRYVRFLHSADSS